MVQGKRVVRMASHDLREVVDGGIIIEVVVVIYRVRVEGIGGTQNAGRRGVRCADWERKGGDEG